MKRADGPGSRFFHDHIHAGDMIQVSAPRGSFTLAAGESPVVLLSAGIGATPVLSMLHSLVAHALHARDLVVLRHAQSQRTSVCRGSSQAAWLIFPAAIPSLLIANREMEISRVRTTTHRAT